MSTTCMVCAVDGLIGADAVGVVHELQEGLSAATAHFLELTAVPLLRPPCSAGV